MKKQHLCILVFSFALASPFSIQAQLTETPAPAVPAGFEEPPVLNASEILQPDYDAGPHYKVQELVPTYAGANRYKIDSDFGPFEANGNLLLVQRIREIQAIATLRDMSKTTEFKEAVKNAAKSPLVIGKQLITDPVNTLSGVPKGIWKFMNRAGQGIKEASEGRERSDYEDSAAQSLIGFSAAKRAIALQLGVDPYSTNSVFQEELNGIAWASYAGGMTIKGAMAVMTGGASTAISAVSMTGKLNDVLREKSPGDLRLMNLGKLLDMGISRADANAFLNNPALSPTHQTGIVMALESLSGVSGRVKFIRMASKAGDESDAVFLLGTAAMISKLQQDGAHLKRITSVNGLPVCLAKDGTVIVVLQWDYAAWTEGAGHFIQTLHAAKFDDYKITGFRVAISGDASPLAQEAMKTQGSRFDIRQEPGPLK